MSSLNGIPGIDARTRTTGQLPAAQSNTSALSSYFQHSFQRNMATVFERGAAGAFDDPTIALAEQAAIQRLRIAAQESGPAGPAGPTMHGANGAPTAPGAGSAAEVAARRDLLGVRIMQSEARLDNISGSLRAEFPKAAMLPSASTGSWDPATFEPRTREEAEAFAQRMVIDATEGAARLEIVQTQLDAARLAARTGTGDPADVARLEQAYDRQRTYVDKLAGIVDGQSGGMVSAAGDDAMAGTTLRGADDLPVEEIAVALRASGMSERQVSRVIGATELAVEEERTPGGSPRLKKINDAMTKSFLARFEQLREQHVEAMRTQEQEFAAEQRALDTRAQQRRSEEMRAQVHALEQARARRILARQP